MGKDWDKSRDDEKSEHVKKRGTQRDTSMNHMLRMAVSMGRKHSFRWYESDSLCCITIVGVKKSDHEDERS